MVRRLTTVLALALVMCALSAGVAGAAWTRFAPAGAYTTMTATPVSPFGGQMEWFRPPLGTNVGVTLTDRDKNTYAVMFDGHFMDTFSMNYDQTSNSTEYMYGYNLENVITTELTLPVQTGSYVVAVYDVIRHGKVQDSPTVANYNYPLMSGRTWETSPLFFSNTPWQSMITTDFAHAFHLENTASWYGETFNEPAGPLTFEAFALGGELSRSPNEGRAYDFSKVVQKSVQSGTFHQTNATMWFVARREAGGVIRMKWLLGETVVLWPGTQPFTMVESREGTLPANAGSKLPAVYFGHSPGVVRGYYDDPRDFLGPAPAAARQYSVTEEVAGTFAQSTDTTEAMFLWDFLGGSAADYTFESEIPSIPVLPGASMTDTATPFWDSVSSWVSSLTPDVTRTAGWQSDIASGALSPVFDDLKGDASELASSVAGLWWFAPYFTDERTGW